MKPISKVLLITFFSSLLFSTIITGQVKINERVEIKESNTAAPTKNAPRQTDAVMQTIRVELTFAPYNYDWPGSIPVGHIEGQATIFRISGGMHIPLETSGKVTGGSASVSYTTSSPPAGWKERWVGISFSTTLGHTASKHNRGNANVRADVYLNNVLQDSFTSDVYSAKNFVVFIRSWSCEKNLEISEPSGTETVHIIPWDPDASKTIVKAKMNNYAQGDVTFNFELTLTPPVLAKNSLSITNSVLSGDVVVQNSDVAEWEIPWDESVKGGENTKLTVTAFAGDAACSKEISDPFEIIVEESCKKHACGEKKYGKVPTLNYTKLPNPALCTSARGGVFKPAPFKHLIRTISAIEACYNETLDQWQFSVGYNNSMDVEYSLEICENNLKNRFNIIYSVEGLKSIDTTEVCKVFSNFVLMEDYKYYTYGAYKDNYYVYELAENHELTHLGDFKTLANDLVLSYKDKFTSFKPSCSDINKIDDVELKAGQHYKRVTQSLVRDILQKFYKKVGKKGSETRKKYEQETQETAYHLTMKKFIDAFKKLHPNKDPKDYCGVDL